MYMSARLRTTATAIRYVDTINQSNEIVFSRANEEPASDQETLYGRVCWRVIITVRQKES